MKQNEQIAEKFMDALGFSRANLEGKTSREAISEIFVQCMRSDPERLLRNFVTACKSEDFEALKVMVQKSCGQHYVKHVVGELTENVQRCVICGEVINDYRNAMWPAGQKAPTGFPEGDLYITKAGNPKMYCSSIDQYDTFENCS